MVELNIKSKENIFNRIMKDIWIQLSAWDTGKREPQLGNFLYGTGLWGIFLILEWCWRPQNTVCSAIPGQMVLGCGRKQAEEQANK